MLPRSSSGSSSSSSSASASPSPPSESALFRLSVLGSHLEPSNTPPSPSPLAAVHTTNGSSSQRSSPVPSPRSSSTSSSNYPIDKDGLQLRPLELSDHSKGFVQLLGQLTDAGTVTKEMFEQRFKDMQRGEYHIWVIEDTKLSKIIATTTLLIERKFIHSCGVIGHIEDVVVNKDYRGKNLGFRVVEQLCKIGKEIGCYKIILDCEPHNVAFYNRLGFKEKGRYMGLYF